MKTRNKKLSYPNRRHATNNRAINQPLRDSALDPPELLQPVTTNSSGSAVGYGGMAYDMCTMSVLPTRVLAANRVWFRARQSDTHQFPVHCFIRFAFVLPSVSFSLS